MDARTHTALIQHHYRLFEGRIESTIKGFGISSKDFLAALVNKSDADETVASFIEMLLAVEDFEQVHKILNMSRDIRTCNNFLQMSFRWASYNLQPPATQSASLRSLA